MLSPECGLHLVDEAVHLEVDVLVQGQELDALKHVKDVPLGHVDGLNVLEKMNLP